MARTGNEPFGQVARRDLPTPDSIDTSLVRIRTKAGGVVGAGFLVSERHILTCAHVIAQALGLPEDTGKPPSSAVNLDFPRLASHTLLSARVVIWCPVQEDGRGDIAGLELLDQPPEGTKATHFASSEQTWQHPYRAFGFPTGQDDGVWSSGSLLGRQGTNWIQLEDDKIPGFAVIQGFSGAPVWDEQFQGVVGMIVASSQPVTTKTAFAIPSDVLIASWPELAALMRPLVPRNPYKGLRAFTEHDTRDFFGREPLIDQLAIAVGTALTRQQKEGQQARLLTVVLGPSGSGKSSVVMAGLLPCLRDGGVFNSQEWVYLDPVFPGAHPLEALAVSLARQLPARSVVSLHDDLASASARSLHLLVCQLVASPQQRVVLTVDQFEEVFTLTTDEAKRRHFIDLLVTAVTEPHGPLFVILTLRADFYDRPMNYPELFRLIDDHHVSVLPLTTEDLRRVIEEPANLPDVQLTFESGLVEELLSDMQGQSGALPLLEFTLDQLVRRRNGHQLTLQVYHEIGGVKGALCQHAEETYQALPSDEHRQLARDVFLRLVSPGVIEQDTTRRRAARSEFELADPVQTPRMQETLETFVRARLLTTNQVDGTTTIEVSHEALIREWKRLAEWLHEARNDIRFQQSLSEDVEEWKRRKQPRDRLYRGTQLKEAQAWAKRNQPSEQEGAFLHASATRRILLLVGLYAMVFLLLFSSVGAAVRYGIATSLAQILFPPNPTLVTMLQDNVGGSLRWCIDNAPSGSTIRFASGMSGTIELTGGSLVFAGGKQLTIAGPGAKQLTVTGNNASIHVSKSATLNISGLSFQHSRTRTGAFLFNEGILTLANSVISDNKTTNNTISLGGGIENSGTLIVANSTISDNSSSGKATSYGGGIYNEGKLTVTHSTFSNNTVNSSSNGKSYGGGIYNSRKGTFTVTDSTFSGNSSRSAEQNADGGAISNYGKGALMGANSTLSNNTVSSNGAHSFGGGIYNSTEGTFTVANSTFSGNSSSAKQNGQGGAINNAGKLTVTHSSFLKNAANSSSGSSFGGGICNYAAGTIMVTNSTFLNNSSSAERSGKGGAIDNDGQLTVMQSTFSNNSASSYGGGINNDRGTFTVTNSTFSGNSSGGRQDGHGGAIRNKSKLTVTHSTILGNTVVSDKGSHGGGIDNDTTGILTVTSSIIAANSAHDGPDIFGALISGGYNLLQNFAGATGLDARTDGQVALTDLKIDSTLRDNSGPTQTLALLPGSPAIDAVPLQLCKITITDVSGQPVTISTDQRSKPRPDGSENACDIGAYESSYQG